MKQNIAYSKNMALNAATSKIYLVA